MMKRLFIRAGYCVVILASLLSLASVTSAQSAVDGGKGSSNPADSGAQKNPFQLVSCDGVDDPRTLEKEVPCDYNQMIYTVARVIRYIFYIMIPVVLGMIIYTGFKYMAAGGDANLLKDAKAMFKPIFIGIALILGAYLIVYQLILGNLLSDQIGDIKKEDIINSKGSGF